MIVKEEGEGYKLQNGDKVFVHYSGELIDGTVFDSSYDRGEPLHFVLGNAVVIKCWEQGFKNLSKGTKADLVCPPRYGYG